MNRLKAAWYYIKYYILSKSKHAVHPPFAYNLLTEVILDKKFKQEYILPETIRRKMLKSDITIEVNDLGAGSFENSKSIRKIKNIAKNSLKSPKYAQLIYRLAKHFNPNSIIEIGTSLGITSAYLAQAIPNGKVFTIEGCEKTAAIASQNFLNHHIPNIEIINNNFEDALPCILKELKKTEFVFFDGNHRKEPTLKYFELCLQYVNNDSVFIFDDIHWSKEMEDAWQCIQMNNNITLTLDFHFLGIAFFRKELSKQNFLLRF
jgi:predicted O-methyltransferase YrrM